MSSAYRDPQHNAQVGGVPNSQHTQGTGNDFVVPEHAKAGFIQQARALGLEAIDEGDHIHVELPPQSAPAAARMGGAAPSGGFGPTDSDRVRVEAEKTAAVEGAKRDVGLRYAEAEAKAAAELERQKAMGKGAGEYEASLDKRASQAADTMATLEEAMAILPQATGSGAGAMTDSAAAFAGHSTGGAQATARLKLLAAKLVASVPRFEGPQSNIDVKFYIEAAGDLANDKLPNETRMAAAELMMRIAKKYAEGGSQPAAPAAGGGWGMTRVK
jgi:hypothetical protein